jgi:hypothetical protein
VTLGASFHCGFLLGHPPPIGRPLRKERLKPKTEYDFVEGRYMFAHPAGTQIRRHSVSPRSPEGDAAFLSRSGKLKIQQKLGHRGDIDEGLFRRQGEIDLSYEPTTLF